MKAIIVDAGTGDIAGVRNEMLDWASGIGVDTRIAAPQFVIIVDEGGRCTAVFSIKRQRNGHDYGDPGTNRAATDYGSVAIDVPHRSWPRWFGEPVEVPDVPIPALLEILAAASEARFGVSALARRASEVQS